MSNWTLVYSDGSKKGVPTCEVCGGVGPCDILNDEHSVRFYVGPSTEERCRSQVVRYHPHLRGGCLIIDEGAREAGYVTEGADDYCKLVYPRHATVRIRFGSHTLRIAIDPEKGYAVAYLCGAPVVWLKTDELCGLKTEGVHGNTYLWDARSNQVYLPQDDGTVNVYSEAEWEAVTA